MDKEYMYFEDDFGHPCRVSVERDYFPTDPREETDISHMMIWWNQYGLGDRRELITPPEYLLNLCEKYDDCPSFGTLNTDEMISFLESNHDYLFLPLYIYEHSGLTISTSGTNYPFNDRWDAGQAGFIYTTKDEIACLVTDETNWKIVALRTMSDEVKEYDMYLQGQVYGIIIEELADDTNPYDESNWQEVDSIWNLYSNKYGYDLIRELYNEVFGKPDALRESFYLKEENELTR